MRAIESDQLKIGENDIAKIKLDLKSRDDIPSLLRGLQHIYTTPSIRNQVFKILETLIPQKVDRSNGRPGMGLWKILVLGVLRVNLNWDYDRTQEMANNHSTIRQMLGHDIMDTWTKYHHQTVKDNVSLFSPEILGQINKVVVTSGHEIANKKGEKITARVDSCVVKTDVHYPTDINLLFDAMRKVITLIAVSCSVCGISQWRQHVHNIKKIKKLFRVAQTMRNSSSGDDKKKKEREQIIKDAHLGYLSVAGGYVDKAEKTLKEIGSTGRISAKRLEEIGKYITHAKLQIDQIGRRVIQNSPIPHDEKVFSIFEEHTEWISKGKAGTPVELGLRVCFVEDQYGFILHHKVMEKETDSQIAVAIINEAQRLHPISQCSFDKGFYSAKNMEELKAILEKVVMPKRGKLTKEETQIEHSKEFIKARHAHSAVESGINGLQVHGLDRVLDHGLKGYKRYVALAVLGRNIQKLGMLIRAKEKKAEERQRKAA